MTEPIKLEDFILRCDKRQQILKSNWLSTVPGTNQLQTDNRRHCKTQS